MPHATARSTAKPRHRFARWLLPLGAVSLAVSAQTGTAPGAGQTLQQLPPAAPAAAPRAPRLQLDQGSSPAVPADATPIPVQRIELRGATMFAESTLRALVAPVEGTTQSLSQLQALARRITEYYRDNGQPLARAYLPVQTVRDGVVRIDIVEAVYGQVTVHNRSDIDSRFLADHVAGLQPGARVASAPLERSLLLLQELPGVDINAIARPGVAVGSTDLLINAEPGPRYAVRAGLDNMGSAATGRARANATMAANNLLGRGDTVSATLLSAGARLNYARIGIRAPVNATGTSAGLAVGLLDYQLGGAFAALRADGTARVTEAFVQHALVRDVHLSLNAEARLEDKHLKDRVGANNSDNNRRIPSLTIGLNAEMADRDGSGGLTSASAAYTHGRVRFDNTAARDQDQGATGARTEGNYGRWNIALARLHTLNTSGTSVYARWRMQSASKNLDPAEQISIGGPYGVRGYDANALTGAQGYQASLEVRQTFAQGAQGTWQAAALLDAGQATILKTTTGTAVNKASLRSVGVGINWASPHGWSAQLVLARPLGTPAIALERRTRAWLQVNGVF